MATHQTSDPAFATQEVKPVPPELLDEANARRDTDPGWQQMQAAEMEYIRRWRRNRADGPNQPAEEPTPANLTGLALSGGGIRSATFSLGVMQALAHRGVLKRIDYLSTVSGGGYIGSAVSWLVSDAARKGSTACGDDKQATGIPNTGLGMDAEGFPYGTDDPAPNTNPERPAEKPQDKPFQQRLLRYLAEHGYYMTPGKGVTAFSLLGAVLRGTLLNLLVWIPIFTLFFLVGLWFSDFVSKDWVGPFPPEHRVELSAERWPEKLCWWGNSVCVLPHLLDALPQPEQSASTGNSQSPTQIDPITAVRASLGKLLGFELFLYFGILIFALLLLLLLAYSVMTWPRRRDSAKVACIWYKLRRIVEQVTAKAIPAAIAMLVIGTLPVVGVWLHGWMVAGGPIAVIAGAGMTIRHFFTAGLTGKGAPAGLMVSIGAGLLLYGVALVAYEIAYLVFTEPGKPIDGDGFATVISLGLIWTVLLGWCVNLNHISVHRYYRDRLMEAFMPDIDAALANKTGQAIGADSTPLQDVAGLKDLKNPEDPNGPYHIVNTTAILVNSEVRTYSQRGGDNFILSPLYCGGNATGWKPTEAFMGGKMTLATAMAISGAALNPNSGVGGVGLTRNKVLSLVMSLLNLRLSYWARNPSPASKWLGSVKLAKWGRGFNFNPNHLFPGAYSFGNALGLESGGFSEKRDFIQISDGGQFEDLGVYELIRRRVGLIIVCDGGQDGEFSFSDLQIAVQRVWTDFGARITINPNATPDRMVPMHDKKPVYPKDKGFAERGYMVCKIAYNNGSTGTLLFLKTTLIRDVSFRVKGYAAQNPDFPDQTTADQFFDEVQFEAYRELGYRIALQMLDAPVPADELEPTDKAKSSAPTQTLEALIKGL